MGNLTAYQTRRHPIAAGIVLLVLGPYLLGLLAIVAIVYALCVLIDVACGRNPFFWRP